MKLQHFTPIDHLKVGHFTSKLKVHLSPTSTIRETLKAFLDNRADIGCVTAENRLIGIVHKYTIFRALLEHFALDDSIEPLINQHAVTVNKDLSLLEAKKIMVDANVSQAVVLNHHHEIYGIMSKSDLIYSHVTANEELFTRMRTLVDNLEDAVILVDSNLMITTINLKTIEFTRLGQEMLIGIPVANIFPLLKENVVKTLQTGALQETKRFSIHDLTLLASIIPIHKSDEDSSAMIVLRDITSYDKIADELESTNRLKRILDSALEAAYDGVIITDDTGKITMVNRGFLELFDIQKQTDVIYQPLSLIAPQLLYERSLKLNQPPTSEIVKINNRKCIVSQVPIYQNDKKVAVIYKIIYKQLDTWKDLLVHLEQLENEISFFKGELSKVSGKSDPFSHIITQNKSMENLKQEAIIAAKSFSSILITGESGTGKELIAQGIHNISGRKGNFIKVNCAAIPPDLLESEFFGYADGAFTGAKKGGKPGKFQLADNGTLFLDEIGDMPLPLQAKLLRVLQEQEFEKIGDTKTTKVNVRIISATNKDLNKLMVQGKFREDLYYRIHVIQLNIPPLRNRIDDLPLLCSYFVRKFNKKVNKKVMGVTPAVIEIFQKYHWPGNVRQLENVLERAFHFSFKWIDIDSLPQNILNTDFPEEYFPKLDQQTSTSLVQSDDKQSLDRKQTIFETDKELTIKALQKCEGNRTKAANILGISRTTLYNKMKKYGIEEELNYKTN